jgi:hypothetical protein
MRQHDRVRRDFSIARTASCERCKHVSAVMANTRCGVASVRSRPAVWRARYLRYEGKELRYEGKEPSGFRRDGVLRLVRCARLGSTSKGFRNLGGLRSLRGRRRERFSSPDPPQTLWCPCGPGCCLTRPPGCPQAWPEASPTINGCRSRSRCWRLDSANSQKSRMSSGDRELQRFTGAR